MHLFLIRQNYVTYRFERKHAFGNRFWTEILKHSKNIRHICHSWRSGVNCVPELPYDVLREQVTDLRPILRPAISTCGSRTKLWGYCCGVCLVYGVPLLLICSRQSRSDRCFLFESMDRGEVVAKEVASISIPYRSTDSLIMSQKR